jgi:hypothetical protein
MNKVQSALGIVVTDQLLDKLGEVFPDKLPNDMKDTHEKNVCYLMGQQSVIQYLKNLQQDILEDALNRK